ncbi:hypothetical protein ACH5RR_000251 [Cinchona calisaya]|uniref:Flap endonuclease GEN-like 1 n=1 Tax=Cinchona calisaya TaxID=153742 RepID=A0ABD3B0K7_9GENT
MGVGGHFWDLLKPYARQEGFDFLRNKRVAVDLSYWIVQHETAIKGYFRHPHLRLTFFRTINLFSKFGAFPVFVVDGTPSPLKSQARILRFFRASGIDLSSLPVAEESVSVERNQTFRKCVQECVELLELLGMPVMKAKGEAEALCAQLNREGRVDACITADSDAFLFGAKCVIKSLHPNSKEPFECYHMSDIEAGLGLKRKHLIAISLLVGNDHDLNGVRGIGVDTALRFVKPFTEDEILIRLHEIGRGDNILFPGNIDQGGGSVQSLEEECHEPKSPHCSLCGHPGSKKAHLKSACQYCSSFIGEGCMQKPVGFKCNCSVCNLDQKAKQKQKKENWQLKICKKIALEPNFPNMEIVEMYLRENNGIDDDRHISWANPKTELLIDYLAYSQNWEPSYIRQRMLPLLSTIFLREMASDPQNNLLCEQYEFHSIHRVKVRFGHQLYVVKWKKPEKTVADAVFTTAEESSVQQELEEAEETIDLLDEPDVPQVQNDDGCWYLLTDEDIELVRNAFPEKVEEFLMEQELKETKSKRKKPKSESPRGVQLSITEFYRSSKVLGETKSPESTAESSENKSGSSESKRKDENPNFSKSARRRLLFG